MSSRRRHPKRDHPRVCGEHGLPSLAGAALRGSSPRVRGTQHGRRHRRGHDGIIPACAGNTDHCRSMLGYSGDHPRVCGEHCLIVLTILIGWGSSPRVRGTPETSKTKARKAGIIPACAGNTCGARGRSMSPRDHPRVCGEHITSCWSRKSCTGSSPRVRGTHPRSPPRPARLGIIPACAGNTDSSAGSTTPYGDHPRVCGEHRGPSPDTWGPPGIIPACAGNTC